MKCVVDIPIPMPSSPPSLQRYGFKSDIGPGTIPPLSEKKKNYEFTKVAKTALTYYVLVD